MIRSVARWRGSFVATPEAGYVLRIEMAAIARECGLSDQRVGDVKLAVSEAVSNVVRHAKASRVEILVRAGTEVVVRVADNGTGLPSSYRSGRGLHNLEDRAARLGGSFAAAPAPGGGTVIEWRVPRSS